jgi:hypothetical protein
MKSSKLHVSARSGAKEHEASSNGFVQVALLKTQEGYATDEVVAAANLLEESLRPATTELISCPISSISVMMVSPAGANDEVYGQAPLLK